MHNYPKKLAFILACTLLLSGCGNAKNDNTNNTNTHNQTTQNTEKNASNTTNNSSSANTDFFLNTSDIFTERDLRTEYDENTSISIALNNTSASCDSDTVKIEGSTITIQKEGTYVFSGNLDNGMIIIDTDDSAKLQLVFNGVTINHETSAPLYILEADKVFLTLVEGTTNTLSNGGTFTAIDENNIDSVIFSKQDLTINGSGSLTVSSPAGHGIVSKDDLVLTGGSYTIGSASHGLSANDSVRITNASITIAAGNDGIQADNDEDEEKGFVYIANGTFNLETAGDGISASSYVQIENGTFEMLCGGGYENGDKTFSDSWGNFGGGMSMPQGGMGGGRGGRSGAPSDAESDTTSKDTSNNGSDTTSSNNAYNNTLTLTSGNNLGSTSNNTSESSSTSMKGIKSAKGLLINGGTFTIDSADDALHSDVSLTINGGTFAIASGDDAIHAEETLTISSGTIDISESYEGLEGLNIAISGGTISIVSTDDGINAAGGTDSSGFGGRDQMFGGGGHGGMSSGNGSIVISGGNIFMYASGDGIDANGYLEITGGDTIVTGPTQGDTAILDYDSYATITGGSFIGVGSTMMAQTFGSDSTQGCFAVTCGNISGGTALTLTDSNGKEVVSYTPETAYACIILSNPNIQKGETYTITVGDISGEFEAN